MNFYYPHSHHTHFAFKHTEKKNLTVQQKHTTCTMINKTSKSAEQTWKTMWKYLAAYHNQAATTNRVLFKQSTAFVITTES